MADGSEVSERWARWRAQLPIEDYEARFAAQQAAGQAVHGEADLISSYSPTSVLDAGCGTGRVAIELAHRGIDVVGVDLDDEMLDAARRKAPEIDWLCADLSTFALGRTFDVVALPGNVMIFCRPHDRAPIVARCAAHLSPGGLLIAGFNIERGVDALGVDEYDAAATDVGLELVERFAGWRASRSPVAVTHSPFTGPSEVSVGPPDGPRFRRRRGGGR